MDGLGERDQRLLGVRPLVEVHDRVLGHAVRDARLVRRDARDAPVGQVVDVVEARHVDLAGLGEAEEDLFAPARTALGLPRADDLGHVENGLLAVADDRAVDELRDRLGVEGRMPAREDDGVVDRTVPGLQRDARQVQGRQHVRVAQLRGEGQAEHVEGTHGAVAVHGELRHLVLAHQLFEVGPHAVRALRQHAFALVQHLVQDHDALVGQPDLVRVRVHERPADVTRIPRLDGGVELTADVLDGLLHMREQSFELWEDRLGHHATFVKRAGGDSQA